MKKITTTQMLIGAIVIIGGIALIYHYNKPEEKTSNFNVRDDVKNRFKLAYGDEWRTHWHSYKGHHEGLP